MAADSATSLVINRGDHSEIVNVYRYGNKVFNLVRGKAVSAMTAGMGSIGSASIQELVKEFRSRLTNAGDEFFLNDNINLENISNNAAKFLFEEKFSQHPVPAPHTLEFWIGGFSTDSITPELWYMAIQNGALVGPKRMCGNLESGIFVGGQPEPILRLLNGFDHSLTMFMQDNAVPQPNIDAFVSGLHARSSVSLHHPAMPIQDAIELADFFVDVTKRYFRFKPGADTVGGDTDIAVVTRYERFKWIKRKHFYPAELNPRETGHGNDE
ncbi:MAG: hypothetical protein O9306_12685 [Beijerinckiaceae bacterium]|nr:hypothetical protein [Beijerinckiaceae bacterium]